MGLSEAVIRASRAFERVAGWSWCVRPAAPMHFFGDVDAYRASPLRMLTVGPNPSRMEFPVDRPFSRFPLAEGISEGKRSRNLDRDVRLFRDRSVQGVI